LNGLAMESKPPRRTREKILELSLKLFNEFGESNVTTTIIANEMKISPGNLYYHFRNKDDIVNSIFSEFDGEIEHKLAIGADSEPNVQDVWNYLQMMFRLVWRYRFLYRDLNDLLSKNRYLETHFKQIFAHKQNLVRSTCLHLKKQGFLEATDEQIEAVSHNMVLVATYWLSYQYVQNPRTYTLQSVVEQNLSSGSYQVMIQLLPFLRGAQLIECEDILRRHVAQPLTVNNP
jgi:AcrR family transcriptional regulator